MSKFKDGSYGSLTGIALIGKVLAGRCGMKYTRAAVGSGTIPDGMTPKTMLDPAGYVMDAKIAAITNPIDGECQVTVQIKSDDVETGFYVTNIVLYAEDPDTGEVPYTYLSLENEPEWIRPASSIVGKFATFDLIVAVGDVDAVSALIDPEAIATIGEVTRILTNHNFDPNAHSGISTIEIVDLVLPAANWHTSGESEYGYVAEIEIAECREAYYPDVAIHKDSLKTAFDADVCTSVQSLDGKLRFWAKRVPAKDISATAALLISGISPVNPGGSAESGCDIKNIQVKLKEKEGI